MDKGALFRLMAWLSPSYPVGAFAYSHGLEYLVETGVVTDKDGLRLWLADILRHGGGWSDAVLFRHAFEAAARGDRDGLRDVADLARAMAVSKERKLETMAQGRAFLSATRAAWPWEEDDGGDGELPGGETEIAYPVAVAMAAAGHGIDLEDALNAYLHGVAANLVSAGVRLVPLGQTDGQRTLAALEPVIGAVARSALTAPLEAVGGCALLTDIASMNHETQYSRLFRS